MSYDIDSIDIIESDGLSITRERLDAIWQELQDEGRDVPEGNLFDEDCCKPDGDGVIRPASLWWYGEGSGHCWEVFRDHVLPAFDGSADLVICWEGGDSYTGLRLRDHQVTEHEVEFKLGKQTKG